LNDGLSNPSPRSRLGRESPSPPGRGSNLLPLALLLTVTLTAWWAGLAWRDLGALRLPHADDMLRLAQIRDWIDGQAFSDFVQQRLGPPGGTDMAWSRLPDFFPGALIRLLSPALGVTRAEIAAVVLWPEILLLVHLMLAGALARRLGPPGSAYPAIALAALAFPAVELFAPGRIAHHGMLLIAVDGIMLLLATDDKRRIGIGAAALLALVLLWPGAWPGDGPGLLTLPLGDTIAWTGLPLVALVCAVVLTIRKRSWPFGLFAAVIGTAVLASLASHQSLWFAAALAPPVMAQVVAAAGRRGLAWQVPAWIVSAGLLWQAVGELALSGPSQPAASCSDRDTLSALRRLDTGSFAAPLELSAYIVGGTQHRSLAGPHRRNARGNGAMTELFLASPEEARYQASLWTVDYIALCPSRTGGLPAAIIKPANLAGHLLAGAPPAWLDPVPLVGSDLLVWRVQPVAAPRLRP
jgi:hypothetical protein